MICFSSWAESSNSRLNQALLKAAEKGNAIAIKKALDQGANVNSSDLAGWTALMLTARWNHTESMGILLKHPQSR